MFAYCLNNPANYYDPTGCIAIVDDIAVAVIVVLICVTAFAATELLVVNAPSIQKGWESLWTAAAEAAANLTDAIAIPKEKADSVTKEAENTILPARKPHQYFGAEISNGSLRFITGQMDFDTAVIWVNSQAAFGCRSAGSLWGVYTLSEKDAKDLGNYFNDKYPYGLEHHGAHIKSKYKHPPFLVTIISKGDYIAILLNFIFGMEWLNMNRRCYYAAIFLKLCR